MWSLGMPYLEDVPCKGMVRKLLNILNMCEEVIQPDDITFICLLSACSHAGLVDEGRHCYASMVTDYMVSAKLEH
jgi:pentatricopeptide repeat protein